MNIPNIDDNPENMSMDASPSNRAESEHEFVPLMTNSSLVTSDMAEIEADPTIDKIFNEFNQIDEAQQKFKEIIESIDAEEENLQMLEKQRKKLEQDMVRLQNDIKNEKEVFRVKIEADLARQSEQEDCEDAETSCIIRNLKTDPLSLNTEELEKYIQELRDAIDETNQTSLF